MTTNMPQFGHSCNPRKDVIEEIELIADMGFDYAELTMEAPHGDPLLLWKRRARIKNALKRYNMSATAHAPLSIDLGHFFEPARKLWVGQSKRLVEIAAKAGIRKINFHANYSSLIISSAALKELILKNHVKSFGAVAAAGKKHGVVILLENTHESFKSFRYITGVKNLFITLDVGHAFMHGGNALIAKYIRTFGTIAHIHAHDNNGRRDEHLAIGQGKINFPLVVKELKAAGFSGTVTLEVFTKNRALAKTSLNKLKEMWLA